MFIVEAVVDKKAENKIKKMKADGASPEAIKAVKKTITSAVSYFFDKEFTQKSSHGTQHAKFANYLGLGFWDGELAQELEMDIRPVELSDFKYLVDGVNPVNKEKIAKKSKAEHSDFTQIVLSPPKDFSELVFLDDAVSYNDYIDIANKALEVTMQKVAEDTYARLDKTNAKVKANKLLYATFLHETSRATSGKDDEETNNKDTIRPDMQIHFHVLVSKFCKGEDGQIRTMMNRHLYDHQKFYGTVFRAEIAKSLMGLGFEVEAHTEIQTSFDDEKQQEKKTEIQSFKIKGITNEMRKLFSKRKAEIEYIAQRFGTKEKAGKSLIARTYRNAKDGLIDRDELISIWKDDANSIGLTNDYIQSLKTFNFKTVKDNVLSDEDLVRGALKLTKKKTVGGLVYERELKQKLAEYSQYVPINIEEKLQQLLDDGIIKKTAPFTYKANFILASKSKSERTFYQSKDEKQSKFLGEYLKKEKSPLIQIIKENKEKLQQVREQAQVKIAEFQATQMPQQSHQEGQGGSKNRFPSFTPTTQLSSTQSTIESLYNSIESLMNKLRNPKLSASEVGQINEQINQLRLQLEELEKKKKNEAYPKPSPYEE